MDSPAKLSFKEAIAMGKYEPSFFAEYPEWVTFDRAIQFQYISQGIANRRRLLRIQWAGLNNQLDFSKKPYLKTAVEKVEKAIKDLNEDEERLFVEYAGS